MMDNQEEGWKVIAAFLIALAGLLAAGVLIVAAGIIANKIATALGAPTSLVCAAWFLASYGTFGAEITAGVTTYHLLRKS